MLRVSRWARRFKATVLILNGPTPHTVHRTTDTRGPRQGRAHNRSAAVRDVRIAAATSGREVGLAHHGALDELHGGDRVLRHRVLLIRPVRYSDGCLVPRLKSGRGRRGAADITCRPCHA